MQYVEKTFIDEWLGSEAFDLSLRGWSFGMIAAHLNQVIREHPPEKAVGKKLPQGFRVGPDDCRKALMKAVALQLRIPAEQARQLDSARCERLFRAVVGKAYKGELEAVRAAVRVLSLKAALNGYAGEHGAKDATGSRRLNFNPRSTASIKPRTTASMRTSKRIRTRDRRFS